MNQAIRQQLKRNLLDGPLLFNHGKRKKEYNSLPHSHPHPDSHSHAQNNKEYAEIRDYVNDSTTIPENTYQQLVDKCETLAQLLETKEEDIFDNIPQPVKNDINNEDKMKLEGKMKKEVKEEAKEEMKEEIKEEVKEEMNEEVKEEDCTITKEDWEELARTPLYTSSHTSVLEALLLCHQYIVNSNTNKTYSSYLIQMMNFLLPQPNNFPPSYAQFMRVCYVLLTPNTHTLPVV